MGFLMRELPHLQNWMEENNIEYKLKSIKRLVQLMNSPNTLEQLIAVRNRVEMFFANPSNVTIWVLNSTQFNKEAKPLIGILYERKRANTHQKFKHPLINSSRRANNRGSVETVKDNFVKYHGNYMNKELKASTETSVHFKRWLTHYDI